MNKQQEIVRNGDALSHYIHTEDKFGNPVNIPVIDVRDGIAERLLAKTIVSQSSSSKYINYGPYQVSRKNNS